MSRISYSSLVLISLWVVAGCQGSPKPSLPDRTALPAGGPLADAGQLVTVVSSDWNDFPAVLQRYQRGPSGRWHAVGPEVQAVLGRHGYGWGRGLHGSARPVGAEGPLKVEGDGRSPAGVFRIGTIYGYAAARPAVRMSYQQASPTLRCVDDATSRHYNRIVSTESSPVDWSSAEKMRREDDLYVLAIVIEHNVDPVEAGAGSCIFLHLWNGPDVGMSGCTAMAMNDLEELADWLEPGAILVALPRPEYAALRELWSLP